MSIPEMSIRLERLKQVRKRLVLRADLLSADLALNGLIEDLIEATEAVLVLTPKASLAAFSLTRTAFEAAQRIVVLATDDDYLRTGTRAWLYYQRKDMRLLRQTQGDENATQWFRREVDQLRCIWEKYNEKAADLLSDETARLIENEKNRRADNFMGRDLAVAVQEAYPKIAKECSENLPKLKALNNAIYGALSRESHTRLRVEIAGIRISPSGAVHIIPRPRKEDLKFESLIGALDSSLSEAIAALQYLLERRNQEEAADLRRSIQQLQDEPLKPGLKPDLGLLLARMEGTATVFQFPGVPVNRVGVLEDGTVCWSANLRVGDREYAATFDVPLTLRDDFASAAAVRRDMLRQTGKLETHSLPQGTRVNVECKLGSAQQNADESFIPLVVVNISKWEPGS